MIYPEEGVAIDKTLGVHTSGIPMGGHQGIPLGLMAYPAHFRVESAHLRGIPRPLCFKACALR